MPSRPTDECRAKAKAGRQVADAAHSCDLRRTALAIAEGWEQLANQVPSKPALPSKPTHHRGGGRPELQERTPRTKPMEPTAPVPQVDAPT